MEQGTASEHQTAASPIFNAYRRGYDPEQVDRYITEQKQQLDEANERAGEAERKLAVALGQMRDLHRRVAILESEERPSEPVESPSLDTLGERVQRILQEAWDGSYALREVAEREVAEMRDRMGAEAEEIIETARQKAEAIEQQIDRRRRAFVQRLEQERERARAELSFLREQRKAAVDELLQAKTLIETTVRQVTSSLPDGSRSAPGGLSTLRVMPTPEPASSSATDLLSEPAATRSPRSATEEGNEPRVERQISEELTRERGSEQEPGRGAPAEEGAPLMTTAKAVVHAAPATKTAERPPGRPLLGDGETARDLERRDFERRDFERRERERLEREHIEVDRSLPPTVPVHRLPSTPAEPPVDVSDLVRNHRAASSPAALPSQPPPDFTILEDAEPRPLREQRPRPAVFDFEVD